MVFWPSLGLRVDVEAERATLRVLMVDDDRAVSLDRAARSVIVSDRRSETLQAPRSDLTATLHAEGPRPMASVPRSTSPGQAPDPTNPAALFVSCASDSPRAERGAE
jgi:hypothetical protein